MTEHVAPRRIAIIGLGLIGGSLARSLRAQPNAAEIVGCVETEADAALARELKLADRVTTRVADAVADAGVVVIAVGIDAIGPVCAQLRGALAERAVVTDVGSTKASVIADARARLDATALARFVPGHPIAGTEHSGLRAGVEGLFAGRRTILTPLAETESAALARIEQLWQSLGARVTTMDAAHHDEVLAATSHLPHLLAFALVDTLAGMAEEKEIFEYAAGGFADFSRIASSDPELWTRILFANRDAVLPALDRYIGELNGLRRNLVQQQENAVTRCFSRAKRERDRFAARDNGRGGT